MNILKGSGKINREKRKLRKKKRIKNKGSASGLKKNTRKKKRERKDKHSLRNGEEDGEEGMGMGKVKINLFPVDMALGFLKVFKLQQAWIYQVIHQKLSLKYLQQAPEVVAGNYRLNSERIVIVTEMMVLCVIFVTIMNQRACHQAQFSGLTATNVAHGSPMCVHSAVIQSLANIYALLAKIDVYSV